MADNKKLNELPNLGEAPAAADKVFIWDESAQAHKYVTYTDLVSQVVSDATAAVTAHANLTAAHGTTGNIVGTTDTQTLTNKTITAPSGLVKADVGLGNVTNVAQVKAAGDQTVTGIKTFSSSPIVPDPTAATQATNKQWVEGYVTGLGKSSVGLLTQGKFIDTLTTNLRFSAEQGVTQTSLTAGTGDFLDTLDGVTYISSRGTGGDVFMYDMTLSGTAFTINQTLYVSSVNGNATAIKYLSPTEAVIVYNEGSATLDINISYLKKTAGTWAVVNTVDYVSGLTNNQIYDIYVVSSTEFYIAVKNDANNFVIKRYLIAGGNVVIDATFSTVTINNTTMYSAVFNSATEVFVQYQNFTKKYSFSSGTSTQIGTTLTATTAGTGYMKLYSNNNVMLSDSDRISTYFFDGTNFKLVSKTLDAVTISGPINGYVQYPTNTFVSSINKIVLTGTGYENSIEDLDANGHIGHMISQNEFFAIGPTFSIIGSTGNDGSYTNTTGNSLNKVITTTAPAVTGDMVCTIQPNLSTRNGYAWRLKGSNYYLGTN